MFNRVTIYILAVLGKQDTFFFKEALEIENFLYVLGGIVGQGFAVGKF